MIGVQAATRRRQLRYLCQTGKAVAAPAAYRFKPAVSRSLRDEHAARAGCFRPDAKQEGTGIEAATTKPRATKTHAKTATLFPPADPLLFFPGRESEAAPSRGPRPIRDVRGRSTHRTWRSRPRARVTPATPRTSTPSAAANPKDASSRARIKTSALKDALRRTPGVCTGAAVSVGGRGNDSRRFLSALRVQPAEPKKRCAF